ncbi:hypothetical protein AZE42_13209 [Rhizopogon vesiculosus]|uniref:Uncharacterized protein n=1 Tax=Rhizopogon vesiculosus TaxID=180088 RepID=A0A1J8QF81_9AGAM|nr:hypothetical protein AZE42_13209 [Rhizopogon vesiculosus]
MQANLDEGNSPFVPPCQGAMPTGGDVTIRPTVEVPYQMLTIASKQSSAC